MSFFVTPEKFYGPPSLKETEIDQILLKNPLQRVVVLPPYLKSLLGPSRTWKVFNKQNDAMSFAKSTEEDLMAFAFEHGTGQRSFLVCHPIMLWFVGMQQCQNKRCTYEIIQEQSKSKLYFDIEFETEHNQGRDGMRMVDTTIAIFCYKLQEHFNVFCLQKDVLQLESSTSEKFSCHLIFQLGDVAFENNYAVGNFVKTVCKEIIDSMTNEKIMEHVCNNTGLEENRIRELLITDRKGYKKTFIDTAVYTKNRHFRLLGSTKLHKNSPLVISQANTFKPNKSDEYAFFLSSLITYFDNKIQRTLNFGPLVLPTENDSTLTNTTGDLKSRPQPLKCSRPIERFIEEIIHPDGRIRKRILAEHEIIFEIVGYRYCSNIGRPHRSNNIKLIVDMKRLVCYQMCYDPECKGFRSKPQPLPSEIVFSAEDESFLIETADNMLSDQDVLHFMTECDDSTFINDNVGKNTADLLDEESHIFFRVRLDETLVRVNSLNESGLESADLNTDVSFEQSSNDLSDSDMIGIAESVEAGISDLNEDSMF